MSIAPNNDWYNESNQTFYARTRRVLTLYFPWLDHLFFKLPSQLDADSDAALFDPLIDPILDPYGYAQQREKIQRFWRNTLTIVAGFLAAGAALTFLALTPAGWTTLTLVGAALIVVNTPILVNKLTRMVQKLYNQSSTKAKLASLNKINEQFETPTPTLLQRVKKFFGITRATQAEATATAVPTGESLTARLAKHIENELNEKLKKSSDNVTVATSRITFNEKLSAKINDLVERVTREKPLTYTIACSELSSFITQLNALSLTSKQRQALAEITVSRTVFDLPDCLQNITQSVALNEALNKIKSKRKNSDASGLTNLELEAVIQSLHLTQTQIERISLLTTTTGKRERITEGLGLNSLQTQALEQKLDMLASVYILSERDLTDLSSLDDLTSGQKQLLRQILSHHFHFTQEKIVDLRSALGLEDASLSEVYAASGAASMRANQNVVTHRVTHDRSLLGGLFGLGVGGAFGAATAFGGLPFLGISIPITALSAQIGFTVLSAGIGSEVGDKLGSSFLHNSAVDSELHMPGLKWASGPDFWPKRLIRYIVLGFTSGLFAILELLEAVVNAAVSYFTSFTLAGIVSGLVMFVTGKRKTANPVLSKKIKDLLLKDLDKAEIDAIDAKMAGKLISLKRMVPYAVDSSVDAMAEKTIAENFQTVIGTDIKQTIVKELKVRFKTDLPIDKKTFNQAFKGIVVKEILNNGNNRITLENAILKKYFLAEPPNSKDYRDHAAFKEALDIFDSTQKTLIYEVQLSLFNDGTFFLSNSPEQRNALIAEIIKNSEVCKSVINNLSKKYSGLTPDDVNKIIDTIRIKKTELADQIKASLNPENNAFSDCAWSGIKDIWPELEQLRSAWEHCCVRQQEAKEYTRLIELIAPEMEGPVKFSLLDANEWDNEKLDAAEFFWANQLAINKDELKLYSLLNFIGHRIYYNVAHPLEKMQDTAFFNFLKRPIGLHKKLRFIFFIPLATYSYSSAVYDAFWSLTWAKRWRLNTPDQFDYKFSTFMQYMLMGLTKFALGFLSHLIPTILTTIYYAITLSLVITWNVIFCPPVVVGYALTFVASLAIGLTKSIIEGILLLPVINYLSNTLISACKYVLGIKEATISPTPAPKFMERVGSFLYDLFSFGETSYAKKCIQYAGNAQQCKDNLRLIAEYRVQKNIDTVTTPKPTAAAEITAAPQLSPAAEVHVAPQSAPAAISRTSASAILPDFTNNVQKPLSTYLHLERPVQPKSKAAPESKPLWKVLYDGLSEYTGAEVLAEKQPGEIDPRNFPEACKILSSRPPA